MNEFAENFWGLKLEHESMRDKLSISIFLNAESKAPFICEPKVFKEKLSGRCQLPEPEKDFARVGSGLLDK
jgi:hypothetical protein